MSGRERSHRIVGALRKERPAPLTPPDSYGPMEIAAMLREIGIALIEVAQPTPIVEARLLQIASRYTSEPVRVVALPTVLMIQIGEDGYQIEGSTRSSLQLDAAGRIDDIASLAAAGAISPSDAIKAVDAARHLRPRFGNLATILGYAVTTVGFGMVINPTWAALPGYLLLGLVVGAPVRAGWSTECPSWRSETSCPPVIPVSSVRSSRCRSRCWLPGSGLRHRRS